MRTLPRHGPIVWKVAPKVISGVALAAVTASPPALFHFPRKCMVTGLYLMSLEATFASLAALEISIQDETNQQMFTDNAAMSQVGIGVGVGQSFFASALMMHGLRRDWFPLRRWVNSADDWKFIVRNVDPAVTVTPSVFLRYEVVEDHVADRQLGMRSA